MKRRESSNHYFRQRIPLDVLEKARGLILGIPIGDQTVSKRIGPKATEVKVSLQTADSATAKIRQANAAAYLEGVWQSLRDGPKRLTHKQIVALSGELYKVFVSALENDPGPKRLWTKVRADNATAMRGDFGTYTQLMIPGESRVHYSLKARFGAFMDLVLAKRGLVVDDQSRKRLLKEVARAMDEAAHRIEKYAEGDYSDDGARLRFPDWEDTGQTRSGPKPAVSLTELFEGWWKEAAVAGATESTREGYERSIRYFKDFLGHDDATKVTPDDVVAFKDHRLHTPNPRTGKPVSPKTVKDSDLAALKSVFGWAVNARKLPSNPASGITVKRGTKIRTREERYFTEEETTTILAHAKKYRRGPRESRQVAMAKRWVPWLCAYTGSRIGEMCQLRKQDVSEEYGIPVLKITPIAGTTKNKMPRAVPIHQHLIDEGFLDFVQSQPDGYLFLTAKVGGEW
jgi:integrase